MKNQNLKVEFEGFKITLESFLKWVLFGVLENTDSESKRHTLLVNPITDLRQLVMNLKKTKH